GGRRGERDAFGEEESLPELATHSCEFPDLRLLFDTLGNYIKPDGMSKLIDGAHDLQASRVATHRLHKGAVDLQGIDGEAREVAQAGEPGPEVVEDDARPNLLAGLDPAEGLGAVVHQNPFGNLELEGAGIDAARLDHFGELRKKGRFCELPPRDVHAHRELRLALALKHRQIAAGPLQHEASNGHDERRLLGEMDELLGRNGAEIAMFPSQQRLEPGSAAVAKAHQRLVVELELLASERIAELALELHLVNGELGDLGLGAGAEAVEPARTQLAKQILLVAEAVQDHSQEEPQNGVRRLDPGAQLLLHDKRELGVLDGRRRGRSLGPVEGGQLAEHLARTEDGKNSPLRSEAGPDFHEPRLNH